MNAFQRLMRWNICSTLLQCWKALLKCVKCVSLERFIECFWYHDCSACNILKHKCAHSKNIVLWVNNFWTSVYLHLILLSTHYDWYLTQIRVLRQYYVISHQNSFVHHINLFKLGSASLQWRHNGRDGVSNHQPHDFFTQPCIQAQIKVIIKAPRHWPLGGEFTGHRWIPSTNGQ